MSDQITNLLLVEEVEKRPVLYNFYLAGYSKKQETEKAWAEVGAIVKLTAVECKERWKNIRAVFVRHMKPPKCGSITKEKKAYYLSDALQFTVPFIKALGKPPGNWPRMPPGEEEGPALQWDDGNNDNDDDDLASETDLPSPSAAKSSSRPTRQHYPDHLPEQIQNKTKRALMYDNVDNALIEYLDRKKAASSAKRQKLANKPKEEALKMFLLSFIPDLMKMDDAQLRQFKRKTVDIVDDIMSRPPSSSWPSSTK